MDTFKKYLIPALALAIVVVGTVFFINTRQSDNVNTNSGQKISNYQECVDAGYPIMKSKPPQCSTSDGERFTQEVESNKIRSFTPRSNQEISSPLEITGEAIGNWFFEASFPAVLVDANGKQLAIMPITAQGEWLTTNFVPYKGTMTFPTPTTPTGTLILQRDNPSGLSKNDEELRIPVKFAQYDLSAKTTTKVFLNNSSRGAECEKTIGASREVASTPAIARASIEELIKGPSQAEKNQGFSSLINANTKVNSLTIENGVAKIDFSSDLESNSGGSCRALAIRSQITETLKQFSTVKDVVISVNGKTDILQP